MVLSDLPRVLLRRWRAVLTGLCLTVLLCSLALRAVPLRYSVEAELLLLPSNSATGAGGNPYVGLGGLAPASDVLAKAMTDDNVVRTLKAAGVQGDFTVSPDTASAAPLMLITVKSDTPSAALASLELVLRQVPVTLVQLQRALNISESSLITSTEVTRSREATTLRTPQLRALIVAGAGGLGATLLLAAALDAYLEARRRGRSGAGVAELAVAEEDAPSRRRVAGGQDAPSQTTAVSPV